MSTSSSTKEEEIEDQAQEAGGKVNFLSGGCLHLVMLFDSIGVWVSIKENISSICPTSVLIHTFHDPKSAQTIGFIDWSNLAVKQSKHPSTQLNWLFQ